MLLPLTLNLTITLLFPALNAPVDTLSYELSTNKEQKEKPTLMHGGRVIKISTLASAYCTARFNFHCLRLANEWPLEHIINDSQVRSRSYNYEKVQKRLNSGSAHFDARTFNVENDMELLNNIKWRSMQILERL
jgi:hypothetical protein